MADAPQTVSIAGHRLRLTNPDKVIYPATGTTKAEVIHYYVQIAPIMLPHLADRTATRKRWVNGVGTQDKPGEVFFEKNLPDSAPSWIRRVTIQHSKDTKDYPVFDNAAALAWAGQVAALGSMSRSGRSTAAARRRTPIGWSLISTRVLARVCQSAPRSPGSPAPC